MLEAVPVLVLVVEVVIMVLLLLDQGVMEAVLLLGVPVLAVEAAVVLVLVIADLVVVLTFESPVSLNRFVLEVELVGKSHPVNQLLSLLQQMFDPFQKRCHRTLD